MARKIRYTLYMGRLHYESPRTGYMRDLGPATVTADGWLYVHAGGWFVRAGEWKCAD